jgi:caffeoyl-CoA O-methyltransferase
MKAAADAILHPEQAHYLSELEPPRDTLLADMEAEAAARGLPISDPEVASFLAVTARSRAPRFIVELGTNIGYGAIVLARAAGAQAKVLTIESSHDHVESARMYIERAGLSKQIEVREGTALEVLATVPEGVDLAYIDCVKEEYPHYLEMLVPRLSERGVIIADNVLWRGHVARADVPASERTRTHVLRAFNMSITKHPALRAVILPLGDGVAYAVRTDDEKIRSGAGT